MCKKTIFIICCSLITTGCFKDGNNTVKDINKTLKNKSIEQNITKKESILNKMGLEFEDKKIIIDLNKSGHFFSNIEKKLNEKAKEIENEIKSSDILAEINSTIN
ncbi:MAG: hypothetical protein GXO60_03020 [Epsilonproteobacteria bacterium]|nr:hypothetical protein [Campylobacterota bacterium]